MNSDSDKRPITPARLLRAVSQWKYICREQWLQMGAAPVLNTPITWDLKPEDAANLVVRWPERLSWDGLQKWGGRIMEGLRRHVRVEARPIPQPGGGGVILAEFVWKGKVYPVAIDFSDTMEAIQTECLKTVVLYFKAQYLRQGYGCDRVIPGGYVNRSANYYKYLPWLRSVRDKQPPVFEVYGRFGLRYAGEIRKRAVKILSEQRQFRFSGTLELVRYSRSLEEAALSKICVDLPGKGDFCFRLVDYLGIGSCVVAAKHRTTLHAGLEHGKNIIFVSEDLSDLAEICEYYLRHEDERLRIARNSREYFDRHLHRDQLAAYYISEVLNRIKGSG